MVGGVDVVEDAAAGHFDLRQAEVNRNRFRNVEETSVGAQREGEAIETLQDVRALVLIEQFDVNVGRYRIVLLMQTLQLVMRMLIVLLVGSRTIAYRPNILILEYKGEKPSHRPRHELYFCFYGFSSWAVCGLKTSKLNITSRRSLRE